jgi:DNA polymerase/3'-5' exonuclease PolX
LRDYEDLLDAQGADGFRVRAYRRGAPTLWRISINLSAEILARKGRDGLVALPSIGAGIAGVIAEISATGRWSQLERLRGELAPEILFRTIPGIGPQMDRLGRSVFARRMEKAPSPPISRLLHIDSIYRDKAAAGQLRMIAQIYSRR